MKLIQFLWQQSHIIWLQRNNDVHGDSEESKQSTLKSCEARLKAVYSLQEEVSYYDKQIFSKLIEEMLKLPIRQIHKWLKDLRTIHDRKTQNLHTPATHTQQSNH